MAIAELQERISERNQNINAQNKEHFKLLKKALYCATFIATLSIAARGVGLSRRTNLLAVDEGDNGKGGKIWIIDLENNAYTQIGSLNNKSSEPHWLKDGNLIYLSWPGSIDFLVKLDTEGHNSTLGKNLPNWLHNPQLFGDKWLSEKQVYTGNIYVLDEQKTIPQVFTEGFNMNVSPNNKNLAYMTSGRLKVIKTDGNQIYDIGMDANSKVSWMSDSSGFVFSSKGNNGSSHIFSFNLNEKDTKPRQITFGETYDSNPIYSPDNDKIAFVSFRSNDASSYIFIADKNGMNSRRITEVSSDTTILWIDEDKIAARANEKSVYGEALIIVDTKTGEIISFGNCKSRDYNLYQVPLPKIGKDGNFNIADYDIELYRVDASGICNPRNMSLRAVK